MGQEDGKDRILTDIYEMTLQLGNLLLRPTLALFLIRALPTSCRASVFSMEHAKPRTIF